MNGAECLLRTLTGHGVELCLMNPGTSEMQFVSALDRVDGLRGVLCLQEGVCAGAADGYGRMRGKPAATLLHLGPGLANGLSNFHNARKARSPVVNIVGEHSTEHLRYDAPLTADVEAFARPVSGWVKTLDDPARMGQAAAEAVAASYGPPGQVATLIIPADHSWNPAGTPGEAKPAPARALPESRKVDAARALLGPRTALFLGGSALGPRALRAAGQIAASTGTRVFLNRYAGRALRGREWAFAERLAYFPEPAEAMLAGTHCMLLVEAEAPVSFFGYPNRRSTVAPAGCRYQELAAQDEDGTAALEALAEGFSGFPEPPQQQPELMTGAALTPESMGAALATLLPEGAIISDEMVSSGEPVNAQLSRAAQHDLLPVTGGSIGQGLPVALGAALAEPGRKVIALEADGSGLYTPQSLWTMARERLDVTVVVFANRRYRILEVEMQRTGAATIGPRAEEMIAIGRPEMDWVKLAQGFAVEASRARTADEFANQFAAAMRRPGPRLIEAILE